MWNGRHAKGDASKIAWIYIGRLEDCTTKEDTQVFLRDNIKNKITDAKNHGKWAQTSHLRLETHLVTLTNSQEELPYDFSISQEETQAREPQTNEIKLLLWNTGGLNGAHNLNPENTFKRLQHCDTH